MECAQAVCMFDDEPAEGAQAPSESMDALGVGEPTSVRSDSTRRSIAELQSEVDTARATVVSARERHHEMWIIKEVCMRPSTSCSNKDLKILRLIIAQDVLCVRSAANAAMPMGLFCFRR
eukprot:SAG11_NODE_2769_length_2993_cov_3.920180_2_plen_120_part_00